jgi:hypothetical protein
MPMNLVARRCGRALLVGLLVVLSFPWSAPRAGADDALVLPKGRSRVTLDNLFYLPTTKRYNPKGDPEDIAVDFDNRRLDSTVFTLLRPLDALVGGRASIGDSQVTFEYDYNILDLGVQYGLTDRLTLGIDIPYYWVENSVSAFVNSGAGSSANVGINPSTAAAAAASPVIPIALGGRRFSTEDVQNLLGQGLVTPAGGRIPGFGFKRVEDWSGEGLGDITAGAKYQYLRTRDWQLAATGAARFPTGRQDDPDDLADVAWSTGAYALLLRLHNDYALSHLWNPPPSGEADGPRLAQPGDLVLNGTFRYDWVLPDDVTVRVTSDITNPITTNRERLRRDVGDKFEFEVGAKFWLTRGFSLSALYRYGFKLEDRITGRSGFVYETLEQDTDATEQIYIVGLSYSTLPLYMEKKFPVPLGISLSYRDRFAGSGAHNAASPSQILDTRYIDLGVSVLF